MAQARRRQRDMRPARTPAERALESAVKRKVPGCGGVAFGRGGQVFVAQGTVATRYILPRGWEAQVNDVRNSENVVALMKLKAPKRRP